MPTVEAGVLFVFGVTQLALVRVVQEPSPAFVVSLSQQMCGLILRGLGIAAAEADLIAAQASDEVVRRGGALSVPDKAH